MSNELEKQFLDTFGIKVSRCTKDSNCYFQECSKCDWYIHTYPQITDRILLELICICNSTYINGYTNYFMATGKTKEELKEEILKKCIALSKDIKYQVRTLFEEK